MNTIFETAHRCRICFTQNISEILNLGNQPPANSLFLPGEEEPPLVPLRLIFCQECGTIQLGESVDPHYLFSKYVWITGTSKTAIEYSQRFARDALNRWYGENPFVVEVASNDGTFLRRFQENGCRVLGIDPAENLAQAATEAGVPTLARFFNQELAGELLESEGSADIIIARNVIPHVKEIHSVVEGISMLLDEDGIGIIEFHDSTLILDQLQYDYIYHEHLFYYSLASIGSLLYQYGLTIYDVARSPISGGSWVIYFSILQKEKTSTLKHLEQVELKSGVNSLERWFEFSDKVRAHRKQLREIVCGSGAKLLAYGASARSSTLLNFCEIGNQHVSAIIDKNPLKKGLLTPGSRIPVICYSEGLELLKDKKIVLLLAWNFRKEIVNDLRKAGYQGQFIVPFPGESQIQ